MNFQIELKQICVRYGDVEALRGVSARLDYGKICGLIGRNGAGKTTLLSLLGSFMEPTAGTLTIGGRDVFENASVMPHVIYVYQADYREESDKARGLFEAAERYRPNFDRQYAEHLAERFRFPLDKPVKELSKGQQAAMNVTIGLASRSPITIFDEAYLGMDAPTRAIFYEELLEDHAAHPRTVIMSTHHVSEVEHLFEDVLILHRGTVLLHEPIDRLLERGLSVTGASADVDRFTAGMRVLHTHQLGGTKQAVLYGALSDEQLKTARRLGLELGPVPLQELFIHLTSEGNE